MKVVFMVNGIVLLLIALAALLSTDPNVISPSTLYSAAFFISGIISICSSAIMSVIKNKE
jgi:hypothetical protein